MQTQTERLTNIMNQEAGTLKMGDKIVCEAHGPQIVVAPDENGTPAMTMGWQLTLWLNHNKLIGQDPVGVTVPVGVMLPNELMVRQATRYLLEEARKVRDRANSPVQTTDGNGQPEDMQAFLAKMRNDK